MRRAVGGSAARRRSHHHLDAPPPPEDANFCSLEFGLICTFHSHMKSWNDLLTEIAGQLTVCATLPRVQPPLPPRPH